MFLCVLLVIYTIRRFKTFSTVLFVYCLVVCFQPQQEGLLNQSVKTVFFHQWISSCLPFPVLSKCKCTIKHKLFIEEVVASVLYQFIEIPLVVYQFEVQEGFCMQLQHVECLHLKWMNCINYLLISWTHFFYNNCLLFNN